MIYRIQAKEDHHLTSRCNALKAVKAGFIFLFMNEHSILAFSSLMHDLAQDNN